MQIRSKRFRDQPEKPIDRAVWWTEYILRHPNPTHLLSPVRKLGFLRSNLFDIVLVVGVILGLFVSLLTRFASKCFSNRRLSKKKSD